MREDTYGGLQGGLHMVDIYKFDNLLKLEWIKHILSKSHHDTCYHKKAVISPLVPSSIFCFNLLRLNICTSDEDPLDPTSTKRNLQSASTRASSTREKSPYNCNIHLQISWASSWLYVSHLVLKECRGRSIWS